MKKCLIGAVILACLIALILAAIPFAVPPIVERVATEQLARFGVSCRVKLNLGYCWMSTGPGLRGDLNAEIPDSPWRLKADFGAALCQWYANVKLAETAFSESDRTIRKLLTDYPVPAVSNLTFSGKLRLDASVRRTFRLPVPKWQAKARLTDLAASAVISNKLISVEGLSVLGGVSGLADHLDIDPAFVFAKSISHDNLTVSDFHASILASERTLLVTEAGGRFCGGTVALYSLFLDSKRLNAGFTLSLDDIDAGQAFSLFKGFSGEAQGHLHGKIKLYLIKGGKAIRMQDAFLYSLPGETGKLKIDDPESLKTELELAGLDEGNRENAAKVLSDMDYTALRLNLRRSNDDDDDMTLSLRIDGSATRGATTVPVVLNLNIHGNIEQLINTGLKISGAGKD